MRTKRVFGLDKGKKKPKVGADPEKKHKNDNAGRKNKTSESVSVSAAFSIPECLPIPGVTEVSSYPEEQATPFSRPVTYIKQAEEELSNALSRRRANYDMDDEDEDWLTKINAGKGSESGPALSDEAFELIIDAFEKAFFFSPDDYRQELSHMCSGLCSEDVAVAVHDYWLKKRTRRKSALVRAFEVNKLKKRRGRRKKSKQLEGQQIINSRTVMPLDNEEAAEKQDIKLAQAAEAAIASARRLTDLAVEKRNRAQLLMNKANWLMFKAGMAMRIAEEAQIIENHKDLLQPTC